VDLRSRRPIGIALVKRAPWLLAPTGELEVGSRVVLDATETRHAVGALRLRSGDPVVLIDGEGRVATATLGLQGKKTAEAVVDGLECHTRPVFRLTLAVAVLAGPAMDMVVQKAVELGVGALVPVCCDRAQFGLKRAVARSDHWLRISRQALKQCRRAWSMKVSEPLLLDDLVTRVGADRGVVADPDGRSVVDLTLGGDPVLLVGPEGGFAPREEEILKCVGWPKVGLGQHILRAETAAIAGAAVLMTGCCGGSG
jgi:16S rRNA (uracil1498-N3)-methyltransferase